MQIRENVALRNYTTIRLGGPARYFTAVKTNEEVAEAVSWAKQKGLAFFPLGEGSNLIFSDKGFDGLVIKIEIPGFTEIEPRTFKIGGGENWDKTVERVVKKGLGGIEAMSLIPGTAGATPVQNVGAYGQEIKDTLVELDAYDCEIGQMVTITNEVCKFSYRNSIFKSSHKGRYVILNICLRLHDKQMASPLYESLERYYQEHKLKDYSPAAIRQAVIALRRHKLPDPKQIPNVGSFFKNAIISEQQFDQLKQRFPDIKGFPASGQVKVPAGWLIEHSDLAGEQFKNVGLHDKNSLVLVTSGTASLQELLALKELIIERVQAKFGVTLEQEPELIDF